VHIGRLQFKELSPIDPSRHRIRFIIADVTTALKTPTRRFVAKEKWQGRKWYQWNARKLMVSLTGIDNIDIGI
jgi:hypothetical protein